MPPDDMPKSVASSAERTADDAMAASSAAATAASLMAERAHTRAAVKRRRTWPAWAALVIIVAALVGAGYYGRDQIVTAAPQTARLYAALGIPVAQSALGLEIRNLSASPIAEGEGEREDGAFMLDGEIHNLSESVRDVPKVMVEFFDAQRNPLGSTTFEVTDNRVLPGEIVRFSQRIEQPPTGAEKFDVTLTLD